MLTQTDPLGQLTTQTHGLRNRLDEVTYSLHTTPRTLPSVDSESWVYDENGNVEGVTQAKLTSSGVVQETTTKSYDVLDRLETETRYDTKVTGYEYDLKGNRMKVTDFQNVATTYTFDEQDRLKTAVTPEGTTAYGYFPDGLLKTTAFFNGTHEGRCYDDGARLTALVTARSAVSNACLPAAFVSRHRYAHDGEGNRLGQFEELTPAGGADPGSPEFTEYGYDDESRLVGVRYPDDTAALYQLDAVGNRVGERKAASSMVPALTAAAFLAVSPAALTNDVVAVFNRADWLEAVTDSRAPSKNASFEWDAAGNLTRQQTAARDRRFTWDVKQTLTKVEDDGIEAGRYDYGADGLRSKRVTALDSVEYVLDGMQVLVETDGATSGHPAKRRYTYAANALAVTDISGATRTTKALHLDALGSPVGETTQTGQVSAVRQYDAWGQYRNGTAPGSADAKLGYTGHQYDPETKLVYARARYYDPEYGRFLSRDSFPGDLTSPMSLHRFTYAHGNPMRYTDPSGRFVPLVILGGIIAWEALVIHNEVTTGQGLTESNDALNQSAMRHFESEGIGALSSDASGVDTAAALTTTTGGQFATGAFFGLPNLVLHPMKAAESAVRIPERFIGGAGKVITGQGGESARLEGLGEMGGAFGEAALVAAAVRGGMGPSGKFEVGIPQEIAAASAVPAGNAGHGGGFRYITEEPSTRMVGQEQTNSCGPACARQLLRDQGIEVPEQTIRDLSEYHPDYGTNAGELARAMNELAPSKSHQYRGGGVDPATLQRLPTPFIARLKSATTKHNVVVESVEDGFVRLRDPWGPQAQTSPQNPGPGIGTEATMSIEDFTSDWNRGMNQVVIKQSTP